MPQSPEGRSCGNLVSGRTLLGLELARAKGGLWMEQSLTVPLGHTNQGFWFLIIPHGELSC